MSTSRPFRLAATSLLFLSLTSLPAFAVNKDMIQLQTQIQQLQEAVARLQQSNDERMGVLKDLVQQTADSVNKMSVSVDGFKLQMQNQQEAAGTKSEQLSGQIQAMNDTLDELKARMARLDKAMSDVQGQQQSITAALTNLPQPTTATPAPASIAPTNAVPPPGSPIPDETVPAPAPKTRGKQASSTTAAPRDLYAIAYGDYMAAKYPLASSEFQDLAATYPDDTLSGNAYFYLGEINLRTQKPTAAVKAYDHVIEHFPDNNKVPAAHLHKAEAMMAMKQNDGAIRELRALIQRFPNSPEASAGRTKLNALTARR